VYISARMTRRPIPILFVAGVLALAIAAPAAAQSPAPPAATPPPATPPPPAPAPAPAPKLSITTERVTVTGGRAAAMAGQAWRVRVVMKPLVAGQSATVRFYRDGRKVHVRQVALKASPTGGSSFALVPFTSSRTGRIVVRATHRATPEAPTAVARAVGVSVLSPDIAPGARGPAVRMLQTMLASAGYVVGVRGVYDARTARAVLAFRKVTGMARTTVAGQEVFSRLARGGGQFRVRFPEHGKHVEADLSRQVIALIRDGKVERIYHVSSGKASTPTIRGHFRVYLKTPGTNAKGMVFSSYFIRGYAIHGYASVPVFPASHGCLRVPVPDAVPIYRWLSHGDRVDVYV
jgi:lipoprotein-anchoring transpeptidase ErfK/SrfK